MKEWQRLGLVFSVLLVLSLVMTRAQLIAPTALLAATAPLTRMGVVTADNLQRALSGLSEQRHLSSEVKTLQRDNEALRQKNVLLTLEVSRLHQVMQITATQAPTAVATAQVVAVDPSPLLARLTLNKGSADGLQVRMPVTVPSGLVGQIIALSAHQAVVVSLVDPESSVGVTLAGGKGGRGIAVGAPPDRLKVEFTSGVNVEPGDTVITSSLGGIYPVGIRVGQVEKVLPLGSNDVTRTVIVRPTVDVGALTDVTVLGRL